MDCENCRHLTVVGLHCNGPRSHLSVVLFLLNFDVFLFVYLVVLFFVLLFFLNIGADIYICTLICLLSERKLVCMHMCKCALFSIYASYFIMVCMQSGLAMHPSDHLSRWLATLLGKNPTLDITCNFFFFFFLSKILTIVLLLQYGECRSITKLLLHRAVW